VSDALGREYRFVCADAPEMQAWLAAVAAKVDAARAREEGRRLEEREGRLPPELLERRRLHRETREEAQAAAEAAEAAEAGAGAEAAEAGAEEAEAQSGAGAGAAGGAEASWLTHGGGSPTSPSRVPRMKSPRRRASSGASSTSCSAAAGGPAGGGGAGGGNMGRRSSGFGSRSSTGGGGRGRQMFIRYFLALVLHVHLLLLP
jgi:hypothetical protein